MNPDNGSLGIWGWTGVSLHRCSVARRELFSWESQVETAYILCKQSKQPGRDCRGKRECLWNSMYLQIHGKKRGKIGASRCLEKHQKSSRHHKKKNLNDLQRPSGLLCELFLSFYTVQKEFYFKYSSYVSVYTPDNYTEHSIWHPI